MEEVALTRQNTKKLRQSLLGYELIVDSAEQPAETCGLPGAEKNITQARKKYLKNQFIVLPNGEDIVDVIVGKLGKTSDINLFRASCDKLDPKQRFFSDKAYMEMRQCNASQKLRKPKLNSKNKKTKNCLSE